MAVIFESVIDDKLKKWVAVEVDSEINITISTSFSGISAALLSSDEAATESVKALDETEGVTVAQGFNPCNALNRLKDKMECDS